MRILAVLFAVVAGLLFARPAEANIIVKIDKTTQVMDVTVDGKSTYQWKVSSGRRGYETPVGIYMPYRMHTMWRSKKYQNAPMPHSIFFHGGYAIHGTTAVGNLGRMASHGCIRLHPANAKTLFELVKADPGITQIIIDTTPAPAKPVKAIAVAKLDTPKAESVKADVAPAAPKAMSAPIETKAKSAAPSPRHAKAKPHAKLRMAAAPVAPAMARGDDGSVYGVLKYSMQR